MASASRTARREPFRLIDGKARLVSDLFCDGLGACIGTCPEGAISVIEREAVPYDEKTVMENIVRQGAPVIKAHLEHLAGHDQIALYDQAVEYLIENGIPIPDHSPPVRTPRKRTACTCRGAGVPAGSRTSCPPLRKQVTAGQEDPVHLPAVPVRQPGAFPAPDHGNRWVGRPIPNSGNGRSS